MANSNQSRHKRQSEKPSRPAGFPLFAHASGRWCKKIKGRFVYFGPWDNPDGALERWLEQKDDLLAGRTPRVKGDGLTVRDLCNRFLTAKKLRMDSGELSPRTFAVYHAACEKIVNAFGKRRLVTDVAADDFDQLRANLAKGRGPVSLRNDVRDIRSVFKYAYDADLIDREVRFGPSFTVPSRAVLRRARQANGKRMLETHELRAVLGFLDGKTVATVDAETGKPVKVKGRRNRALRAMVLLAANCGFGQTDCANLPLSAVDLDAGWLDYPRPKTAIERRCPLWPETVETLRDWLPNRPEAKDASDAACVFLTSHRQRWVRIGEKGNPIDSVAGEFAKVLRKLGLKRRGLNFYALRHGFETIAGEAKDQPAVDTVMGHVDHSMAGQYRESVSDERLQAVVATVHHWLFGSEPDV